ncbi:hypothetical protein [Kitasatospora sp. NPDC001527]|uniref:hypothetical protein n=1 Tax=Kitasatospora sp. NPDC001527 TaxID=3154519 RepID=UPI0033272AB9
MLMRKQRTDLRIFRDVVHDDQQPVEGRTALSPWQVGGDDWEARFALGLRLGDVWTAWDHEPEVEGVASRLWVATTDARSWAAVDSDGAAGDRYTVWQYGPRRLWDEVQAAYDWWEAAGSPSPDRFGLTIKGQEHLVWLDERAQEVRRLP